MKNPFLTDQKIFKKTDTNLVSILLSEGLLSFLLTFFPLSAGSAYNYTKIKKIIQKNINNLDYGEKKRM
jgi:hypothetical protein